MNNFISSPFEYENEYELNFGLQPLSVEGTVRFILSLQGEEIKKCYPCIGFEHKGIEKLAEHTSYHQIFELIKCLSSFNVLSYKYPYILLMEKLLNIKPSRRVQFLRVIFAEIERILNHMKIISAMAQDLGSDIPKIYEIKQSKKIDKFLSNKKDLFQIGGIKFDISDKELEEIYNWSRKKENIFLNKISYLLSENRIFKQRTKGIGKISKEEALSWGLTGVSLRASGVSWDLRSSFPYDAYSELSFEPEVLEEGDIYSRYLLRTKEISQSFDLITQAIENIPKEDFCPISLKELSICPVPGELYISTESPAGELGISIISDGQTTPYRFHIRSPSFSHLQALNYFGKGNSLGNLVPLISSFNLNIGEVDR